VAYNVELATTRSISGWSVGSDKLVGVRCVRNGHSFGLGQVQLHRPDVHAALPDNHLALYSGFAIHFEIPIESGSYTVEFEYSDGERSIVELSLSVPVSLELPPRFRIKERDAAAYLLFLRTCWQKFLFIERYFPKYNNLARAGSKDALCVCTAPLEMLHIADQLYRLCKAGLTGPVCEFGCFKGFSTCCLSHVCFELGLKMEVFDSFAGLPESGSSYYATGDFCGTLDEVAGNVEAFGKSELVTFNEGFFSESLRGRLLNPIIIWMDVDLRSSSRDVMAIVGQLPKESCVVSHECFSRNFNNGSVIPDEGEGDVIAPIVEAMAKESRSVVGQYLTGGLGIFWEPGVGLEPLSNQLLRDALRLATD
jgi:hypothetical protein